MDESRIKEHILYFDIVKAVAIIVIFFHHLSNYTINFWDLNNFGIPLKLGILNVLNGYYSLGLFFFLGGYFSQYNRAFFTTRSEVFLFLVKKIIRIWFLYVIALVLFVFLYSPGFLSTVVHLFLFQIAIPQYASLKLVTLWYVSVIFGLYVVFACFNFKMNQFVRISLIVCVPIVLLLVNKFYNYGDLRFILYYSIFWLGVYFGNNKLILLKYVLLSMVVFGMSLLFVDNFSFLGHPLNSLSGFFSTNMFIFSATITTIFLARNVHKLLSHRLRLFFSLISYSSYCMYLFHRPILSGFCYLLSLFSMERCNTQFFMLLLVGLPLTVLISNYIQRIYDGIVVPRLNCFLQKRIST